jgi:hypothetical protein
MAVAVYPRPEPISVNPLKPTNKQLEKKKGTDLMPISIIIYSF